VLILAGVLSLIGLQAIKAHYREIVFEQFYTGSKSLLAAQLLSNVTDLEPNKTLLERASFINVRFNQGWIVSAIMSRVPAYQPHEGGSTITYAIKASVLPRLLVEKKGAWAGENFQRYTGLKIPRSTTMGISVVGEAYINFARIGGAIFMFIWGLAIGFSYRFLLRKSRKYPTLILWIPLIYLQVVKAETELLIVLNHFVKAVLFTFGFYFIANRIMLWRL
jgi:hypothetical protein